MSSKNKLFNYFFKKFLSEETKEKAEKVIVYIAITTFISHLTVIFLVDWGFIHINDVSQLLTNPIAAIYTPFSFIIIYEVYLLIYYLPQSITTYIGKQYEIITLIIIRKIFKDLSNLELSSNWFEIKQDLQFTYDILAAILLFFLILIFYRLNNQRVQIIQNKDKIVKSIQNFIKIKKVVAVILVPLLLILGVYSFANWIIGHIFSISDLVYSAKSVNNIFFDEFFTVLILVDVLLLLFSFVHTDQFYKVIRNSGFIISTILLRLSFGVEGLISTLLIISAVSFGVIIMKLHNEYEKNLTKVE